MGVISQKARDIRRNNLLNGDITKHPRYKAEKASYRAKHYRVVRLYGKASYCENISCEHRDYHRFEWACLDGEYTMERSAWAMLCVYCHRRMDKCGIKPNLAS